MAEWQSRITGHGTEAPDQLLANPRNWRIHPRHQQQALEGVLDRVGWVKEIIVNETTGTVVDGHLRVGMAISENEPEVPVTYVQLTEDEERAVLAALDPLSALAETDQDAFDSLVDSISQEDTDLALERLTAPDSDTGPAMPGLQSAYDETVEAMCPGCGHEFVYSLAEERIIETEDAE